MAELIGNLEDVSLRLQKTLDSVALIFAEDTTKTKVLLANLKIKTPLNSYHDHNKESSAKKILEALGSGKNVALVSDAGTPGIADPGYFIVQKALKEGIAVVPIPGPSAKRSAPRIRVGRPGPVWRPGPRIHSTRWFHRRQ